MNTKTIIFAALGLLLGLWLGARWSGQHAAPGQDARDGPCAGGAAPDYWAAPMDPSFRRDQPGKSPMGMDLIPVCATGTDGEADVVISSAVEQNLGVRTAAVTRAHLNPQITGVGSVTYDEQSLRMIHARAEGWVEQLNVESEGAAVRGGETLYALFAPKLVAAAAEYLSAERAGRAGIAQAAKQRLLALGYDDAQVRALRESDQAGQRLLRRAPTDAVVTMLGVREGQFVAPGTHIMTLASLRKVWVVVDVLERDASIVTVGQKVRAEVSSWPGRAWSGQVDYVYPSLDPRTRTLRLRLVLDNADAALRPNMFARVTISAPDAEETLVVPRSAVIRGAQGDRVVLALGAGRYRVVAVRAGRVDAGQVQILQGLEAGAQVVVDGQFLIDSEANVDAEALRLNAEPRRPEVARGQARAVIHDLAPGQIELAHEPIRPLGESGIQMPAMRMKFELDPQLAALGLLPGQSVHVIIENPEAGRYVVTQVHVLDDGKLPDAGPQP